MKITDLTQVAKTVATRAIKKTIQFLMSNYLYMIWFVIYFTFAWYMFGMDFQAFRTVAIIYGGSVAVALSPIGEYILRLFKNCRLPATSEEKNYLLPLFEEVFENAKEIDPKLNNDIALYIMDDMHVNTMAVGRKTIAITRGAIATFSADELKGILAHEVGHMTFGHTKALLLTVIGNFLFTAIIWFLRLILIVIEFLLGLVEHKHILFKILKFMTVAIKFIIDIAVMLFIHLSEIILALNSRANEIQADVFAYEVGYGNELISGLYLLQKISINGNVTILERMKASHPHIAHRIENIELLEDGEIDE